MNESVHAFFRFQSQFMPVVLDTKTLAKNKSKSIFEQFQS